uniref:Uncharacterized protein n=1 Tax=Salix viminalis TaxID=40686 RepID=A0A6N2K7D1_SALVM
MKRNVLLIYRQYLPFRPSRIRNSTFHYAPTSGSLARNIMKLRKRVKQTLQRYKRTSRHY